MTKRKEVSSSTSINSEEKLRAKIARMREKIRKQKDKIITPKVKVDELKEDWQEIKMENSQLCFIVGPDY